MMTVYANSILDEVIPSYIVIVELGHL